MDGTYGTHLATDSVYVPSAGIHVRDVEERQILWQPGNVTPPTHTHTHTHTQCGPPFGFHDIMTLTG